MLSRIIEIIAPHHCLGCALEGFVLCDTCAALLPRVAPEAGLLNGTMVYAATLHKGLSRRLVHGLKFGRKQAAAVDLARLMASRLPTGSRPDIVTWVPTATSRVRARGYDQSRLLARALAVRLGVPCVPLLRRSGQQRQVGQSKKVRAVQLNHAFSAISTLDEPRVLLVDDVFTTGATIRAAAGVIYQAGAHRVDAAVFARAASGHSPRQGGFLALKLL